MQPFIKATVQPIPLGNIWRISLLSGLLLLQLHAYTQQPMDSQHVQWVRDLEANDWVEADTIITFDPQVYEEKMQIVDNDFGPVKDSTGELVYQVCDQPPAFPGGNSQLIQFLADNLNYPPEARIIEFAGQSQVTFIVEKDGSLRGIQARPFQTGIYVHRTKRRTASQVVGLPLPPELNHLFEQEAVRVVTAMPKWLPGQQRDQIVKCQVMLPIQFEVK